MRSRKELEERLKQYAGPSYIYDDTGYIAWQISTGENVEILFIEVSEPGRGCATELVRQMCSVISPYNSVMVCRLASNETAGYFYRSLGMKEFPIDGLYKVPAVMSVISYEELCQNLSTKPTSGKNA